MLVATSREGRVFRITLNRPEKRNALNIELCRALLGAFRQAEVDDSIGVVLLDAAGSVFSAGMDLDEILSPEVVRQADIHEELLTIGSRYSKPIVAAVQGAVFGGAVALVANAHVVIAADDAQFCCTEIHIALWPFVAFRAIAAAVGERRATELALTGRVASAADALDWGLATEIVPQDQLHEAATRLAVRMAAFDAHALSQGLLFVQQSRGSNRESVGQLALLFRDRAFGSAAFQSAVRAFLAKRNRK